jgi:hypothetical protein
VSEPLRVAVLEHDSGGAGERLAAALAAEGAEVALLASRAKGGRVSAAGVGRVELVQPVQVPDLPLRLRKIGEAPGRMPGALLALARGRYDIAHAFTAQDAAVAVAWSRLGGGPAVFTQREPLTRANVADRRWRLATLRLALERSDAVLAPDEATAASVRRWMAANPEVLEPDSAAAHLALYAGLRR